MLTSTPLLTGLLMSAKNERDDEQSLESPGINGMSRVTLPMYYCNLAMKD